MKKIHFNYKILSAGLLVLMFSCQKMEYTPELNWAYPMSGEWALQVEYNSHVDHGPFFIKVYNSSFGQDSVWIDDNGNIWPFKAKVKVDMQALTFSTTNYTSYPGTRMEDVITITSGQVIDKDSIYFEAVFASDEETTYKMYGHRASSYDEYMMPHH